MKFGVRIPHSGPLTSKLAIEKVAKKADELDFDTLWFHDHIHYEKNQALAGHMSTGTIESVINTGYYKEPDFYEMLITLSYVSAITKNVRLGTAILILPHRNPVIVAKQAATIDALSNGRLILGVDIGRYVKEYEILNISSKKRESKLSEYIELMKKIWYEKTVDFQGDFYNICGAIMYPKPKKIPIWFGGSRTAAIKRVARIGDGWIPGGSPSNYEEKLIPKLEIYLEEYGRKMRDIEIGCEIRICIAETRKKALQVSGTTLIKTYGTIQNALDQCLIGSSDDIIKRVQKYHDVGVQHMECKFICSDINNFLHMLELIHNHIFPNYLIN